MKQVEKLFYRILIYIIRDGVKYDPFVINGDEDLQVLFYCRHHFSEVMTYELLAKFGDVVCSLGGSNQNPQFITMSGASSSIPVGSLSFVHVIAPEPGLVASPSFAANLNYVDDGEIGDN
ncbi:hypothetical protein Ahy_B04g069937 [Arachis hypogaea]|uniref:Uncharacterized protein n=1 Tax=Arachis hypogaea TaxID=3818 RepID=A0A444ZE03_ARAHY|nr:hypothetical protein Ahy_B04g069937 [Arachis hypogaea]